MVIVNKKTFLLNLKKIKRRKIIAKGISIKRLYLIDTPKHREMKRKRIITYAK